MNKLITKNNHSIANIIDDFFNNAFAEMSSNHGYGNSSLQRIADNEYIIKINVAGFKKEDIEIVQKNGYIHINGEIRQKDQHNNNNNYIYNNFSSSFSNSFKISDDIEYIDASISDGILNIHVVEKFNPNHSPKRINIR